MRKALEIARNKLLERSLRNKLISTKLDAKRSRRVRVIDEISDQVFATLRSGKAMSFAAGIRRGDHAEELADDDGLYVPPEEPTDERGVAARHKDIRLQTRMSPEGLHKQLLSLFYEAQTLEEEQGVNVLFLALGFLEWWEAESSDTPRHAPLLLLPVDLQRDGARDRFRIRMRDDDLVTNVSLQAWIKEQFAIELPDLPEGDEWTPSTYFESVREATLHQARWSILANEILLGFFSFSKFLLWRDLDPANWPTAEHLFNHALINRVMLPRKHETIPDEPLIREDERIDAVFRPAQLVHITDADSSQAIAIQEALSGKNLAVQGPPGTGKSQTITNIIAGAVHGGKTVLFVAEKMAALDVVHKRLLKANLAPICLELHSRKASKTAVLEQIKAGMNAAAPPAWTERVFGELEQTQTRLRAHTDSLHLKIEPCGLSAFDVIGRISLLKARGTPTPDFLLTRAAGWTNTQIDEVTQRAKGLGEMLHDAGVPATHPWRGMGSDTPDPLTQDRLRPKVAEFSHKAAQLAQCVDECRRALGLETECSLQELLNWVEGMRLVAERPNGLDGLLLDERTTRLVAALSDCRHRSRWRPVSPASPGAHEPGVAEKRRARWFAGDDRSARRSEGSELALRSLGRRAGRWIARAYGADDSPRSGG